MKKTLHLVVFATIVSIAFPLSSLAQLRRGPSLSFGGQVVQPLGQFAEKYDGFPAGLAGTFSSPLGRSPFELGVGYAWNNMGSQNEDVDVLVSTDTAGDDIYEQGSMRIRSNINRYQALARFRPFAGRIQPYADAIAGVEAYKTKTDITINNSGYSSATNSVRQHLGMTFCVGWAAGLRLRMAPGIFVEGRFESLNGGLVKFVDQESIQVTDSNEILFETKEAKTTKYTYQLGIAISF